MRNESYQFRNWHRSSRRGRLCDRPGRRCSGRTCRPWAGKTPCTWRCSNWRRTGRGRGTSSWRAGRRTSASASPRSAPEYPSRRPVRSPAPQLNTRIFSHLLLFVFIYSILKIIMIIFYYNFF